MPKGYSGAKKAASFSGGDGFEKRPPGIPYFRMSAGQTANIRILQPQDDIEWTRKWKLAPAPGFQYGELINCIDQHEDGTPDPGFQANLKTSFKAYIPIIWRQAPQFKKDPSGKYLKDAMDNRIPDGFRDQYAIWECSFAIYEMFGEKEAKFRSITNFDWEIKRIGGDNKTKYIAEPSDPMVVGTGVPLTAEDQRIVQAGHLNIPEIFCKIPKYDELQAYLNNGVLPEGRDEQQTTAQVAQTNSITPDGPNPFLA